MKVTFVEHHEAPKLQKSIAINGVDYPILRRSNSYTLEAKEAFIAQWSAAEWATFRTNAARQMCEKEFEAVVQAKTKHLSPKAREEATEGLCLFVIVTPYPDLFHISVHREMLTFIPWIEDLPFPKMGEQLPRYVMRWEYMVVTALHEGAWENPAVITGVFQLPKKTTNGNVYPHDLWNGMAVQKAETNQMEHELLPDYAAIESKLMAHMAGLVNSPEDLTYHYGTPLTPELLKKFKQVQKAVNFAATYGVSKAKIKALIALNIEGPLDEQTAEKCLMNWKDHIATHLKKAVAEKAHTHHLTDLPDDVHTCMFTGAPHPVAPKEQEFKATLAKYGFKIVGKV